MNGPRLAPSAGVAREEFDGDGRVGGAGHRDAAPAGPGADAASRADPGIALLLLARLPGRAVPWALSRLVQGPSCWRAERGLRFARVLGSGTGGGFGLKPGLDHQGVFLMFDRVEDALLCLRGSPRIAGYRERAEECFVAVLQAASARGRWAGQGMRVVVPAPRAGEPLVALTRASIRPARALDFWRQSPAAESALASAAGCRFAVGLGEAPVLRQATVSLWDDEASMNAYARQGAHHAAIAAAWQRGFFSEWMFVRFLPLLMQGRWQGVAHGRMDGAHG